MKRRNLPQNTKNERVKRQRDPLPWRYCFLTLVCGLVLVVGFFYAARQHFTAIDYGIKNAKLRQQKQDLQSEQRKLYLTREISLTPGEIKKAAKKIGFREFTSSSIEAVSRKIENINPLSGKKTTEKPTLLPAAKITDPKEEKPKSEKVAKEEKEDKQAQNSSSGDLRPRLAKK